MRTVLAEHMRTPFEWGRSDCALYADVVWAMTGWDPIALYRGRYRSAEGAMRMIAESGADSVLEFVARRFPEIPPALAQRGDLVFPAGIDHRLMSPAVVDGPLAFSKNEDGPVIMSIASAGRAFAV